MTTPLFDNNKIHKSAARCLVPLILLVTFLASQTAWAQPAGWSYKTPIRIINTTATATVQFQQLLVIDTKSLITAGQMSADCSDLRFGKDAKGVTPFSYYIESGAGTGAAKVWVKIDSVPANDTVIFYMYYGNNAVKTTSTLATFQGPFNVVDTTAPVSNEATSSVSVDGHRGIWIKPKQSILITAMGKKMPDATTNTITLFDHDTGDILEQVSISGTAGHYSSTPLSAYFWLDKNYEVDVDVFIPAGQNYYQGIQPVMNTYLTQQGWTTCNCGEFDLPDVKTGNVYAGYPDMQFYVRNDTIDQPVYQFGPFIVVSPDTLPHAVYNTVFRDTLTATDGIEPFTYSISAGYLPDGFTLSEDGILTGTPTTVGTYNFTVKVTDASAINGAPAFVSKIYDFVLDKADQTIVFNNLKDGTYGDTTLILRATSNSGLPVTFEVAGGPISIRNDSVVVISGTGGALITAVQTGNDYYNPIRFSQGFMITAKPLTITADSKTKTYGDDNPELTVTFDGLVNGDTTVPGLTITTDVIKMSDAGVYDITVSSDGSTNYELTYVSGKFTVNRKKINVKLNATPAISKTYDGSNVAPLVAANYTVTGVIDGDNITIPMSPVYDNANWGMGKTITVDSLQLTGDKTDNYVLEDSTVTTTGDILKRDLNFTLNAKPVITKVYNTSDSAILAAANYALDNVVTGEDITVTFSSTYSDSKVANGKTITASNIVLNGSTVDNYNLLTTTATTTGNITAQPVTVVLLGSPAVAKTYDGNDTATIAAANYQVSGILSTDDVVLNNPVYGSYDSKHVGTGKTVTVSNLVLSGNEAANYQLTSTSVAAAIGTIVKQEITIVADSASKTYGDADSVLTYQVTGLIDGDALSGSLVRETGENVGTYAITIGTLENTDYNIVSFTPSVFKILPAEITVTAEDKERQQGQKNPDLTYTYSGFVNGEDTTVLTGPIKIETAATQLSPIGYYDIVVSGAAASNYYFNYIYGKLTVLPSNDKVRVWTSSRNTMQVRIFSDKSQKVDIVMYTENGQQVLARQQQIIDAINTIEIPVGYLPAAFYVVKVIATDWTEAHKINIR